MPRNVSNTLRIPSISFQTTNSLFSPPHSWSSTVGTTTRRCDRTSRLSRRFCGESTRINRTPWTWWWPWWDKDTQLLLLLALRLNWCRNHRWFQGWSFRFSSKIQFRVTVWNFEKQVCIPVGFVPPACWPYPSMHCAVGVCVYPSMHWAGGGVSPGEVCPGGVWSGGGLWPHPTLMGMTDRQV